MLHLYAALAEKERRLISERTRAALQAMRPVANWLVNPTNLRAAGEAGRAVQRQVWINLCAECCRSSTLS